MSKPESGKVLRYDSIPLDQTYFTEEGYLVDHPIVTSVGIFVYHNADGTERRELRLPEEVFAAKSLASYKGKPVIITHDAGYVDKANVQEEGIGTILSEGYQDGKDVRAEIIIHDFDAVKGIGLRELSLGYSLRADETPGVWEGQPYDAIQRDIEINHLALVDKARAGEQARLNIDGQDQEILKGGKLSMDVTKKNDGNAAPASLTAAIEAFKQRRADRMGAAIPPAVEPTATVPVPEDKDMVQSVKDRRGQRDTAGDPADINGAMGVIAQQDEDIDTLLGIIDVLKSSGAPVVLDKKDGEGEEDKDETEEAKTDAEEDEPDTEKQDGCEEPDKKTDKSDRKDAAEDFRELLRVVRVGDKLRMDGLETMSVKEAKIAVLNKLKPDLRMDGKSSVYVSAAFDMAVSEMDSRKDTNYQRQQMMHKDSADNAQSGSSAAEARQRMIDRQNKKEEK